MKENKSAVACDDTSLGGCAVCHLRCHRVVMTNAQVPLVFPPRFSPFTPSDETIIALRQASLIEKLSACRNLSLDARNFDCVFP